MKAYDRLVRFYEPEWSSFSERFAPKVDEIIRRRVGERASVLDVACGMGTLALALAARGHTVHGVDRSEPMVERARADAHGVVRVSFSVGDMRGPLPPRGVDERRSGFDAATCTFDSVNYLTTASDVLAMLRAVASALRCGGVFVFDSNTERMYRTHEDGIYERDEGGEAFYQETFYDTGAGQATTVFRFDDGAIEVHRQRPWCLAELEPLLAQAGLVVVETYSGIALEPYDEDCDRIVVVASKHGA